MSDIQMQPGDRNPSRYRKTTLSLAMTALIAAGASAPTLLKQFADEKEGDARLVSDAKCARWEASAQSSGLAPTEARGACRAATWPPVHATNLRN
jgi:hypothetical protein